MARTGWRGGRRNMSEGDDGSYRVGMSRLGKGMNQRCCEKHGVRRRKSTVHNI